jgi:hypothetical protein
MNQKKFNKFGALISCNDQTFLVADPISMHVPADQLAVAFLNSFGLPDEATGRDKLPPSWFSEPGNMEYFFDYWILQEKFNERCADILDVDLEEVLAFVRVGVEAPLADAANEVVVEDVDEEFSE